MYRILVSGVCQITRASDIVCSLALNLLDHTIARFITPVIVLSTFILLPLHFLKAMFQEGFNTKELLISYK